jgi:phospholipase C
MHNRREFLVHASRLAAAAGLSTTVLASIQRALAIEPVPGSSYLDAEHVVILMQENRSFDHAFGTLRGVRGFNDPRAITLADGNPVWVQTDAAGERYVPFRLDIKNTKATWMGDLPHDRTDQVDARNQGRYDRWLQAKRSSRPEYAAVPLTLGYCTREDIPFYYALADAFTICDQHFCSSLTPTTPNRLFLWTGTVRERPTADAPALVRNEDVDYGRWVHWTTFPERLEDRGISWKIYQNELTVDSGLTEEEDAWLANFGDSPIEWFSQFNVRYAAPHRAYRDKKLKELPGEIAVLKKELAAHTGPAAKAAKLTKLIGDMSERLKRYQAEQTEFTQENFDRLSPRAKSLHARAFTTNTGDPDYRRLTEIVYRDGAVERRLNAPKGDVLYQFRKDVTDGRLPTVSWLVAPQAFSDHPSAAWYGAWYISEVLNILTHNPEVWKKTIFILTYDENDGYFDHVPPFVAPHPHRPETGRVSKGIDTGVEYVELAQDRKRVVAEQAREGPVGLGYRVPLIVASPWSRGGCVCSQVFDHTSILQFLERFLTQRTGRKIEETNISRWRRTVCGDLTATFQAPEVQANVQLPFLPRDQFLQDIHRAQFKDLPKGYRVLTKEEAERVGRDPRASGLLPRQEAGVRHSCPLPYELVVNGSLNADKTRFTIQFEARNKQFGERSAGSPFTVYALNARGIAGVRNYAVEAGGQLEDSWPVSAFEGGIYRLRVYGPNGFFREFAGSRSEAGVDIRLEHHRPRKEGTARSLSVVLTNRDGQRAREIEVRDRSYSAVPMSRILAPCEQATLVIDTQSSAGWYDLGVRVLDDGDFERRYAGRVETGEWSISDPAMA